jgi:Glycosyl transferase family 2
MKTDKQRWTRTLFRLPHAPGNLTLRLARIQREAPQGSTEALRLCISLGLVKRSIALAQDGYFERLSPCERISFTLLCGEIDSAANMVEGILAERRSCWSSSQDKLFGQVAELIAPINLSLAVGLLQRCRRLPSSAVAIATQAGQAELASHLTKADLFQEHADRWLAPVYSQAILGMDRLGCLNRYLGEFDLMPVSLIDSELPLAVTNITSTGVPLHLPKDGPLLSIILSVHNGGHFLEAAIRSLLDQHYQRFELILIDDESTDQTIETMEKFAALDARIRQIRLMNNVGTYAAKNVALREARGEVIAFHDADDWSHPGKYARCVFELLKSTNRLAVTSNCVRLDQEGNFVAQRIWPYTRWSPNSIVFRRRVLEQLGALDDVRTGADSEFVARLRLMFGESTHIKLRQPFTIASYRPGSLMTAADTGLNSQGRSLHRMAYQEAWTEWHLSHLLEGSPLCLPYPHRPRIFPEKM